MDFSKIPDWGWIVALVVGAFVIGGLKLKFDRWFKYKSEKAREKMAAKEAEEDRKYREKMDRKNK